MVPLKLSTTLAKVIAAAAAVLILYGIMEWI